MYNLFQSSQCQKVSFQKLNKLKNLINGELKNRYIQL
jgi:hypothetical protein